MQAALKAGGRTLAWGERTYVMGIINITPDSFSGDGLTAVEGTETPVAKTEEEIVQTALDQARRFQAEGADILDIGGESTRPGADAVPLEEELGRVLPVIKAVSQLDILISIDTYKSAIAQAAIEAGADIINDVWALRADPEVAAVAARHKTPLILMHNRSSWAHAEIRDQLGGRYIGMPYDNLLEDVKRELLESVDLARAAGVKDEQIILDPGIGFGKTTEQNLELLDRVNELRDLGFPVLLGPSRKSFIGYTLDKPPDRRIEGTAAAVAVGIVRGVDIVRVHDVGFMTRVVQMTDAIVRR